MKYLPAFVLLACSSMVGQVTVVNPDHLEVPEHRVNAIFRTACKVVAEEFHVRGGVSPPEFPLVLVVGVPNERYTEDEEHQRYTIYLNRWNEVQFAASAMRLAIQRMVPRSRRNKMLAEILRRANQIAPVPASAFATQQKK